MRPQKTSSDRDRSTAVATLRRRRRRNRFVGAMASLCRRKHPLYCSMSHHTLFNPDRNQCLCPQITPLSRCGCAIYDRHPLNFQIFDPLPHVHIGQLICTTKFTQPPLLHLLFHDPPTLSDADIISGSSFTQFIVRRSYRFHLLVLSSPLDFSQLCVTGKCTQSSVTITATKGQVMPRYC